MSRPGRVRVLMVSPMPPARDGIATYSALLGESYLQAGHEVAAVSTPVATDDRRVAAPEETGDGVPVATVPVVATVPLAPWRWVGLWRAVRRWRPDVVHVQHTIATWGPRLPAVMALMTALRLAGVPVVVTHHEVTRDVERLGRPAVLHYAVVSRLAGRTHVHTARAAETLRTRMRLDPGSIFVRAHPTRLPSVDPWSRLERALDLRSRHGLGGATVLLMFGFVHVEKGIHEAVDALHRLIVDDPALRPRLRLAVAGAVRPRPAGFGRFEQSDHDYLRQVREFVRAAGLQDLVLFVGDVPDADVEGWFAVADLVLMPYLAAEQSGVAALAVAAEAPVLASQVGGLRDLFGDGLARIDAPVTGRTVARALAETLADLPDHRRRAVERYAAIRSETDPAGLVTRVVAGAEG